MNCNFCNKEYENKISLANHSRHCGLNPNKITLKYKSKRNQWSKENYAISEETRRKISEGQIGRKRSQEFKDNLSRIAKERGLGGHTSKVKITHVRPNGDNIYLQSSYEIKLATILDENHIDWSRPSPFMWIDSEGKEHRYYPDFEINGVFFDTKNDYLIKKDADKIKRVVEQNNIVLHVLCKNDITLSKIKEFLPLYP